MLSAINIRRTDDLDGGDIEAIVARTEKALERNDVKQAAAELAAAEPGRPVKAEALALAQGIPANFLENILTELRRAGLVRSRRGTDGGYWLARPAAEIALACREHAHLNDKALMRGRPMTLDDYLASPVLADPLRLFDSCLISDGGAAFVTTSVERARDLPQPPAVVLK